jgi:hypothetical protein
MAGRVISSTYSEQNGNVEADNQMFYVLILEMCTILSRLRHCATSRKIAEPTFVSSNGFQDTFSAYVVYEFS